jgi:hypothetical protein
MNFVVMNFILLSVVFCLLLYHFAECRVVIATYLGILGRGSIRLSHHNY